MHPPQQPSNTESNYSGRIWLSFDGAAEPLVERCGIGRQQTNQLAHLIATIGISPVKLSNLPAQTVVGRKNCDQMKALGGSGGRIRTAEPSEKMLGILKRLEANGKHLLGLINDVLDLSKIEARGERKISVFRQGDALI